MTEVSEAVWDAFCGDPMDPKNDTAAGLARVVAFFEGKIEAIHLKLEMVSQSRDILHVEASGHIATISAKDAEIDRLRGVLGRIAGHTDPDDPESYRSDDREGCLDTVQAISRAALKGDAE